MDDRGDGWLSMMKARRRRKQKQGKKMNLAQEREKATKMNKNLALLMHFITTRKFNNYNNK